jgi:hypothetical protein
LFRWLEVWRSYWLALGWGTIRLGHWPGGWPYTLFFGLLFLALVGWLRTLWVWWRQPENRPSPTTLVLLGLLFVSLIINMLSLESWMHRVIAPYGRLLFPLIGAISVFLIVGWQSLHPRLPWLAYAYIAALGILTPVILIQPAYTHTALTPAEIAALPPSLGWRFGETTEAPFAELISFTPQETTITAGDILQVKLCWRALATPSQDYSVMVQIIGPENSLLTSQRSYPGEGRYPTSIWQPGEVWCDVMHVLTYTGNVFETLVHKLEIGLLDDKTGERLPVTDGAGNLLASTFIDHVRLIPYGGQLFAANIAKTPSLQLVNRRLSSDWRAGSSATLFLTWVTLEPLVQDYQVFIHLRDLQTGENVINGDGPPLDGWYPTSWWSPYEIIHDVHTVDLPDDLTPGTYQLVVGMYDLASGLRPLPEIDLGPVQVTP